jgi:hypothetical protein
MMPAPPLSNRLGRMQSRASRIPVRKLDACCFECSLYYGNWVTREEVSSRRVAPPPEFS